MTSMLARLLELAEPAAPSESVKLTGGLTGANQAPEAAKAAHPKLTPNSVDQLDRVDRRFRSDINLCSQRRGRFAIGRVYSGGVIERIHPMRAEQRSAVAATGFPGAAIVVVDEVALLVDDVGRMLATGNFTVLGFADFQDAVGAGPAPNSTEARKGRSSRSSRSSRPPTRDQSNLAKDIQVPKELTDWLAGSGGSRGLHRSTRRQEKGGGRPSRMEASRGEGDE